MLDNLMFHYITLNLALYLDRSIMFIAIFYMTCHIHICSGRIVRR